MSILESKVTVEGSSWASDQKEFMERGNQTTGSLNPPQLARYMAHIEEESMEAVAGYKSNDPVALVDGLIDTIVIAIGALHSLGVSPDRAWKIVHAANMRKYPDGKPYYREDGQIGKPPGWVGPEPGLALLLDELGLLDVSFVQSDSAETTAPTARRRGGRLDCGELVG